jgi:hypothetical protein
MAKPADEFHDEKPVLLDARGRPRSHVTLPGYGKGRPAFNKGMKLPAEILTHDEIAAVLDALPSHTLLGKRNRAMITLLYRAEAKVGAVTRLQVRDYDSGVLTIPGSHGGPAHAVRLDSRARQFLDDWMEARRALRLRGTAPLFCTLERGHQGRRLTPAYIRSMLADKGRAVGIQKRVTPQGLLHSRAVHRVGESGRFEASVAEYINAEAFRARFPDAYDKWCDAHQLLETAPERHATTIGHLCREAIMQYSDDLAREYRVGPFETNKTKVKMRAVFDTQPAMSSSVRKSLEALVDYWETVSVLANRQEHGRHLVAEDSRRLVFQTMLVMREIDLALPAGAS